MQIKGRKEKIAKGWKRRNDSMKKKKRRLEIIVIKSGRRTRKLKKLEKKI